MRKTPFATIAKRGAILIVALAIGGGIIAFNVANKQPPTRVEAVEQRLDVRVITAAALPMMITSSGFGTAQPSQTYSAVSNVKGSVIFRHPDLESGAVLPKGTLVLEIDPIIYTLALSEANAEIASIDAEIAQLNQEVENTAILLELELQRAELAEQELERANALAQSGAIPRANLDAQIKATLQQRQTVQTLENQQSVFPIQHTRLIAQRDRLLAKLAQVENDIADTKFRAPFDMRVSEVNAEMYQYVTPGQAVFSADGIRASEVVLQVPMQSLRRTIEQVPNSAEAIEIVSLSSHVQLVDGSQVWDAEVIRIANGIDPATRTVRVVLGIDQPATIEDAFENPPLPKGMYVQGVLQVNAQAPQMAIPQSALHEGWVYLVDADNRLERRAVEVDFQQNGLVVFAAGLNAGDRVILDDIVPAISGILLKAHPDADAQTALAVQAAGGLQ